MYEFSGKLKSFSIALMLIGVLGIGFGFFNGANKTEDDAKEVIAHHEAEKLAKVEAAKTAVQYGRKIKGAVSHESHDTHGAEAHGEAHGADNHVAHALSQMQNRPWAAVFVALFFFFMIALSIFVFYAMQIGASAGWSIVLFRVMEAMSKAIMPLGVLLVIFMLISGLTHMNHIYPWIHTDGTDAILEGKEWWLNVPSWLIRSVVYVAGYIFFRRIIIKKSVAQDEATDYTAHKKSFKYTVFFLAFFFVTETTLAWDWVMSLDPHWFSTLFGWYIFASSLVTAITVIAMVTIYLKSKGYLAVVNNSHIHDLAKYMFGFSIFWTYLWFAQYMLIWYSNMPEETTYFMQRLDQYKFIFYAMVVLNFAFPILILMDSDGKRRNWIILLAGAFIILGHYIDFFVMIMPSTVGAYWHFGIPEIGAILFFLGLFIFCGFTDLTKRSLMAKGNPYMKESEHYHY